MNQTHLRATASPRRRPSMVVIGMLALVVLLGGLVSAKPVTARDGGSDVVRAWNAHALAALSNPAPVPGAPLPPVPGAGQPTPVAALHMAMVQLAVYDAVNSIVGGYQPYLDGLPAASPEASLDAAVATAAHDVLVGLFRPPVPALHPTVQSRLDTLLADTLKNIPDGSSKADGIAAGAEAAAAMLAERNGDGRYVPFPNPQGTGAGEWRPTSGVSDPNAWVAKVRPFTLESSSQFRTGGPRQLDSGAYAKEYNEVKTLGSATSSRTPEQQALADFYQPGPHELFNRAFRGLTEKQGLSVADEARFFAMINVAGADTAIHCWDEKQFWNFWRPITAIREGDNDGNPKTVGDTSWTSMIPAPPYADHTSGYNCYTGAVMHAAQRFFRQPRMDLSVTHPSNGVTREYHRFSDVYADTIEARILQGIHFRSADEQGAKLGTHVANWVAHNHFQREG